MDDLSSLRFEERSGLVPAIVQHAASGRVLMLGYMDREALERTRETGRVTFYSRSRRALWTKGETSGNWLELVEIRADCDADALLVSARPHGPTCHTGADSCFGEPGISATGAVLAELVTVIEERRRQRPEGSYTARLFDEGRPAIARKVGEEALELCIEALSNGPGVADEAADLLYHTLVLLTDCGIGLDEIASILRRRRERGPER